MNYTADQVIDWTFDDTSVEVCAAIGRVSMLWSQMEFILDICIIRCVGARTDLTECLTNQIQTLTKIDALSSLLDRNHPTLIEPFKKVANLIRGSLVGERNLIIHGVWLPPDLVDLPLVAKKAAKGRLVSKGGFVLPDNLEKFGRDIADVTRWLVSLSERLPALPQIPYERLHKPPHQDYALQKALALQPLP